MKFFIASLLLLLSGCTGSETKGNTGTAARTDAPLNSLPSGIDRSPMDMIYYPVDFPILKTSGKAEGMPLVRIIYSRPHRQGRSIFGALVPYGQPWRLGANEATEIELFADATIQTQTVDKGRYILYCLPQADKWTIIFNTALYTWGLKPDSTKDAYRFDVPVLQAPVPVEYFAMSFSEEENRSTQLIISWDSVTASLPLQFK